MEINYTTESPARDYARAIRKPKSRSGLVSAIMKYEQVAPDALQTALEMSARDFTDFKRDIVKAKRKQSAAWNERFNERFGAIALPAKLLWSEVVAMQFGVPWGYAFLRCQQENWPMMKPAANKK